MPSNDTGDVEGDPVIAIVKHGTISAYTNHRCRCPECRAAKARYDRDHYPERTEETSRDHLSDLLNELCPEGLTADCPARRKVAA